MKFTIGELKSMESPLRFLSHKELPVKISWKLYRFMKKVSYELDMVENIRNELVKKYGEENISTGENKVIPENIEKFKNEFLEVLQQEVEIDFSPIDINDIGDINISSSFFISMDKIFKEDKE